MARNKQNIIMLSEDEKNLIEKAAFLNNIGKSKYIRDNILRIAKKDLIKFKVDLPKKGT